MKINSRSTYVLFILFFVILLPFSKFSVTGDIETDLMCISDIDPEWRGHGKCTSRFIHHPFSSLIILILNFIGDLIYSMFSSNFESLVNIKKIFLEGYLNFVFFSLFIMNMILLIKYLIEKYNLKQFYSIVIVVCFFFTSYLGNFLNFETFETILVSAIIFKLFLFKNTKEKRYFINLILDLFIVFNKIVFLFPLVILNYIYYRENFKKYFINSVLIIFLAFLFFAMKNFLLSYYTLYNYQTLYHPNFDLFFMIGNFFSFFLSPSIGIFVTAPLIIFSVFYKLNLKQFDDKNIRIFSFISILGTFSIISTWHGNGSSGSRYFYPLFLIFIDDFYFMFSNFFKFKRFKSILILIFILNFQTLNYHAPVTLYTYGDTRTYEKWGLMSLSNFTKSEKEASSYNNIDPSLDFPLYSWRVNPYFFGWNTELSKFFNKKDIKIFFNNEIRTIETLEIIPHTVISRLFYMSQNNQINEKRKSLFIEKFPLIENIKFNRFFYIGIISIYILLFSLFILRIKR